MTQQLLQLERVSTRIAGHIKQFVSKRDTFHMGELASFVMRCEPSTAPDSPSRVLRMLRRSGELDYVVVNRAGSLYRVVR